MRVDAAVDCVPELGAGHLRGVGADDLGEREVELVHGRVDRVVLDRRDHVEPGLFNTKGEPAGPGEEVDGDGRRPGTTDRSPAPRADSGRAGATQRYYGGRTTTHPPAPAPEQIPRFTLTLVTDTRTPEQRSRIMAAVKGKHTAPEVVLRRALFAAGARGWRCHWRGAPGVPDIAWPARRVAVFVDGAFWHGHPSRHKPGRSGAYWDEKIEANVARDRRVDAELRERGWTVVRIWDFEVRKHLDEAVERVLDALDGR